MSCRCCRVRVSPSVECPPGLYVGGTLPPGSLPVTTVDILGGPYVVPVTAFSPYPLTEIGPQFDLLITNPSATCSFDMVVTLDGPSNQGVLEPGAELQVGFAVVAWPLNTPPADITPGNSGFSNQYYRTNVAGVAEPFSDGTGTKDQNRIITFGPLAPGDFVWFSAQTLIATAGFTGPSFINFPTGYGIQVEGVRL